MFPLVSNISIYDNLNSNLFECEYLDNIYYVYNYLECEDNYKFINNIRKLHHYAPSYNYDPLTITNIDDILLDYTINESKNLT